jgi:hypothetical protein
MIIGVERYRVVENEKKLVIDPEIKAE